MPNKCNLPGKLLGWAASLPNNLPNNRLTICLTICLTNCLENCQEGPPISRSAISLTSCLTKCPAHAITPTNSAGHGTTPTSGASGCVSLASFCWTETFVQRLASHCLHWQATVFFGCGLIVCVAERGRLTRPKCPSDPAFSLAIRIACATKSARAVFGRAEAASFRYRRRRVGAWPSSKSRGGPDGCRPRFARSRDRQPSNNLLPRFEGCRCPRRFLELDMNGASQSTATRSNGGCSSRCLRAQAPIHERWASPMPVSQSETSRSWVSNQGLSRLPVGLLSENSRNSSCPESLYRNG
jgi:hypothetical protein